MLKPSTCKGDFKPEGIPFIDIYNSNWCGPIQLVAPHRSLNNINPKFHKNIYARNNYQLQLFNYVKTYCLEQNINLKWLTPTTYINTNEIHYYLNLNSMLN